MENKKSYTPVTKVCLYCNKHFEKTKSCGNPEWKTKKFCSRDCADKSRRGKPTWNTGIRIDRVKYPKYGHFQKHSEETKQIMKNALDNWKNSVGIDVVKQKCIEGQKLSIISGKKNHSYKGTLGKKQELSATWLADKATYNSKHKWIQKNWKKTGICQRCGVITHAFGKRHFGTEWHNLDRKYDRDKPETWVEVCRTCHKKLDKLCN